MVIAIIQDRYFKNKEKESNLIAADLNEETEMINQEVVNEISYIDEIGKIHKSKTIFERSHILDQDTDCTINKEFININNSPKSSVKSRHFYNSMIESDNICENFLITKIKSNKKKIFEINLDVMKYRLRMLYFHTKGLYKFFLF